MQESETSHRNIILMVLIIGTMMSAVDSTIVLLALPKINGALLTNFSSSIWVILIYLMVVAIFTTQLGSVGDSLGRGRIFSAGIALFTVASVICGLSPNISVLISMRGVQAFGASMMQANSGAIVADTFNPKIRGKAFGYTTLGWNIGGTLGIVLGGVITYYLSWNYIFLINAPIGLVAFIFSVKYIRDSKKVKHVFDFPGIAALAISLFSLSYSGVDVASGAGKFTILTYLAIGIISFVAFLVIETKSKNPIIDLGAFKSKYLSLSLMATFLQATGYLSVVFLLILYLQGVRGLSPLYAALILVPGYVIASFLSPKMGKVTDRFGSRTMATLGIFLMIVAVIIYTQLNSTSSYYQVITGSSIAGVGGSMFWPSNNKAVMAAAQSNAFGSISGLQRTLANIGTLLSFVITISVASLTVPRYVSYQIFLGDGALNSSQFLAFMGGLRYAFIASAIILLAAGFCSFMRSGNDIHITGAHAEKKS